MVSSTSLEDVMDAVFGMGALSLCILLQVVALVLFWRERKNGRLLSSAVLMIANVNIAMQVTLPTVISYFEEFAIERSVGIGTANIFKTIILHVVYMACFLAMYCAPRHTRRACVTTPVPEPDVRAVFIFVLIGMYVLANTFSLAGQIQTYEELAGLARKDRSFLDVVNIYLQTMFEWTGIVAAIFFVVSYRGEWKRLLKVVVSAYCLAFLMRLLAMGLRGGVFIFLILGLFFYYLDSRKIAIKYALAVCITVFPFFSYLGAGYRERLQDGLFEADTIDRLKSLADAAPASRAASDASVMRDNLDSVYKRLEASRNSVSLIRLRDRGLGVSFVPTLSSLMAIIPAQVWPGKGYYPASSTEDVFGTAMYVVRRETYGTSDMGPYLASAHEYWEGGVVYLVLSGLLLGWMWKGLVEWSSSTGFSTTSLLALGCFLDAHHGEISVTAPIALIVKLVWYQVIPMLGVMFLLKFLSKRTRLSKRAC